MYTALIFTIGVILGIVIMWILHRNNQVGVLKVYPTDGDLGGPYLFLELSEDVPIVAQRATVVLKVENVKQYPSA